MDEENSVKFNKTISFKKGERISISIKMTNTKPHQHKIIGDFLDIMYKEIIGLI